MTLPLLIVACGLAVGPTETQPAGRERPAEDHEFYRPVGPVREELPPAAGADRAAPTAEWIEWIRRWAERVLP